MIKSKGDSQTTPRSATRRALQEVSNVCFAFEHGYAQFILLRVAQLAQIDALEDRADRWRKVLDLGRRAQQVLLRRVRSQSAISDGEVLEGVPMDLGEVRLKVVSIAIKVDTMRRRTLNSA